MLPLLFKGWQNLWQIFDIKFLKKRWYFFLVYCIMLYNIPLDAIIYFKENIRKELIFMSILSNKLNEYLLAKKLTPYQLAQNCPFENATLYQYLNGKRPLKKKEHLDIIISILKLTPEETLQVIEAYEIELIGIDVYRQRQKAEELLFSLQTLHNPLDIVPCDKPQEYLLQHSTSQTITPINGELEVNRTAFAIIYNAFFHGNTVDLFLPPNCKSLLHGLTLLGNMNNFAYSSQVTHITCFESDNETGPVSNLERLKNVLNYGIATKNYCPMYFYGNSAEHFSSTNLLPGLILTEQAALQVSSDGKYALFHAEPTVISMFKTFFEQLRSKCYPLMSHNISFYNGMQCVMEGLQKSVGKKVLEISSGLCSVQFWNKDFIETYLNPKLPNYKEVLEYYIAYSQKLYEVKSKTFTTLLIKPSFVLDFIRTGILKEYPQYFFSKPVEAIDRKYLLNCILSACKEGWYQIQFVEDSHFPLDYRWELGVVKGHHILFEYFEEDKFYIFNFEESGLVHSFYDYLENLCSRPYVMSPKDSEKVLLHWIEKYL